MTSKSVTVHMHGGPVDGKSYPYPCSNVPTPETLVMQGVFDGVFKVLDYQRKPATYDYYYTEPSPNIKGDK